MPLHPACESRHAIGALIGGFVGSAAGDALGALFEFQCGGLYSERFPQLVVAGRGEMVGGPARRIAARVKNATEKLDTPPLASNNRRMPRARAALVPAPDSTASRVRRAVTHAGARGRAWRISDFADMPALAVAQALSRLAREGVIVRLSKGVYAVKGDAPGRVRVYEASPQLGGVPLFPCSVTAANMLRLSLQCPKFAWYSTPASFVPESIDRQSVKVVTRRPHSWSRIEPLDGALLEVLRDGCIHSELEPANTALVLRHALLEKGRLKRIMSMVHDEPPRVRAMLGALLERGRGAKSPEVLAAIGTLRRSLNPLSRYRFGQLSRLPEAPRWQARALKPII